MTKELIALLDGKETGRVVRDNHGKLTFSYKEEWRDADSAYPLSLSMPLALAEHPNAKIDPFLWGLLPDNEIVLGNWARKFHVSPRNAFSLIACVGEDCAGAIQFVQPERLEAIMGEQRLPSNGSTKRKSHDVCARYAKTSPPGALPAISASSASQARNRKPPSYSITRSGAYLPAAFPPHIFSSRLQANSTATQKTSISAWSLHALSVYPSSIRASCISRTR